MRSFAVVQIMPTQGDLMIGVPVKTEAEALAIYSQLGLETDEQGVFGGKGGERSVSLHKRVFTVYVSGMQEDDSRTYAVGFHLTDRYKGSVLDADSPHGRESLFVFDPQDLLDLLAQVHTWWPEAKVFLWDIHY
jgi:hypothetical protein